MRLQVHWLVPFYLKNQMRRNTLIYLVVKGCSGTQKSALFCLKQHKPLPPETSGSGCGVVAYQWEQPKSLLLKLRCFLWNNKCFTGIRRQREHCCSWIVGITPWFPFWAPRGAHWLHTGMNDMNRGHSEERQEPRDSSVNINLYHVSSGFPSLPSPMFSAPFLCYDWRKNR